MSIHEAIWAQQQHGALFELRPFLPADQKIRSMYIEKSLWNEILRNRDDEDETERFARLEADLQVFISSPTLDPEYLTQLSPTNRGVWEIRSVRPEPQMRVFGLFAKKDTFLATHYAWRSDLSEEDWKEEIKTTRQIWKDLFGGYTPKTTSDIHELITGGLNEQYFR